MDINETAKEMQQTMIDVRDSMDKLNAIGGQRMCECGTIVLFRASSVKQCPECGEYVRKES